MSTAHAIHKFRLSFVALLEAAEGVRAALEAEAAIDGMGEGPRDVALIQRLVADHFRVHVLQLVMPVRTAPVSLARHVAMVFCREFTPHTVQTLGRSFQRHHAIIAHSVRHVADCAATDKKFAADLAQLRAAVAGALNTAGHLGASAA